MHAIAVRWKRATITAEKVPDDLLSCDDAEVVCKWLCRWLSNCTININVS